MTPTLELDALSVTFRTRRGPVHALRDVHLTVDAGEVLVLVGESGSGKTVLANALTGLLPANTTVTGAVRLAGQDLLALRERDLRRLRAARLALVPQGAATALNPVRRLGRQATTTARTRGIRPPAVHATLERRLDRLHLSWADVRRRYPYQLSGGMQQRVVTTLATVGRPSLIIADEPTNGLDSALVDATADTLLALREEHQAALVVITHDLRLAGRLGGRVAVLYASTIVEVGDTRATLDRPTHPYTRGLVGALPERGGTPIAGLPPQLDDLPTSMSAAGPALLATRSVRHGYGAGSDRLEVLRGIDLTVGRGERIGLAGPSGAGKTTLARIVSLLEPPDAGQVLLDGEPVVGAGHAVAPAVRRRVQLLWQAPRPAVDPRHRLHHVILEPLRLHGELPRGRLDQRDLARDLAVQVGLTPDLLTRRPTEVSDGQLQRACLARALSLHPDLLVADEPGAMLDVSTQAALLAVVAARAEAGMGVLLVSHDLTLLTHWCHRVLVLRDGHLDMA